jgi:hypothetical protein
LTEDDNIRKEYPLSRADYVLLDRGLYIPPQLSDEIKSAVQALSVEQGGVDSADRERVEVKFSTEGHSGRTDFIMHIAGMDHPNEFQKVQEHVTQYLKSHNVPEAQAHIDSMTSNHRIVMRGTNFQHVVNSVVEGFINKFSQSSYSHADIVPIMEKYAPKTWNPSLIQNEGRSA